MFKNILRILLAVKFMRKYRISDVDGRVFTLSRKYAVKDLLSYNCYQRKELDKLSIPDLLYEYVAITSGGISVYNKDTGKEEYVGYAS